MNSYVHDGRLFFGSKFVRNSLSTTMDKSDDTTTKPVFSDKDSSIPVVHMDCTQTAVLDDEAPILDL